MYVLTVLNQVGVCLLYTATWDYLLRLMSKAKYLQVVQDGHWQWVYENLQAVRHERQGS